MGKEYGKLTATQFRDLIELLPEVRAAGGSLSEAVSAMPPARINSILLSGYSWGEVYELAFHEHVGLVVYALGMARYLHRVARAPDPQQVFIEDLRSGREPEDDGIKVELQHAIGLAYSVQRTLLSVMLFQRSMSSLIQEVRESDSSEALFKAVRIDRSVVACPSIADRIARAELRRDEQFFRHLRSALRGPQKKTWEAYCDLRYSLVVLRELGFDRLSDAQLEHLLVDTLRVYSPSPSARKNLRAQYQLSRRIKTI